jgi:hypothetical protein
VHISLGNENCFTTEHLTISTNTNRAELAT